MIKIYTANFESIPMDIQGNFEKAQEALCLAIKEQCDIIVYPQGFLLGAPLGVLKNNTYIKDIYNSHVHKLCGGIWLSRIFILCDTMTDSGFESSFSYQGQSTKSSHCQVDTIKIACYQDPHILFSESGTLREKADLFILNWSKPTVAGEINLYNQALTELAKAQGIYFILCLGGRGYTTYPYFYKTCVGIVSKAGSKLAQSYREIASAEHIHCIDVTRSLFIAKHRPPITDFPIDFNENPLIPINIDKKEYCLDLFDMQSASLAVRMNNIGCRSVVLNLSGGLDSTLALLVCLNAFDMLGLDKSGIHVLTMPGFGSGEQTKSIAENLCKTLSLSMLTIDITTVCKQALSDIGHDGVTPDIVFENVQARMRTLNSLNLANKYNAIMVGTGDLSEEALGFSTYGGDQMANYNVNCCVSKTVIRTLLPFVTELPLFLGAKDIVLEVLDLPVSPELLPTDGKISQKTEEILAPYKLLDFFLYCLVVAKLSPQEWVEKALFVFKGDFTKEYLEKKQAMFCKKFAVGQFKRSSSPESAAITHITLSGMDGFYPSDGSISIFTDFSE